VQQHHPEIGAEPLLLAILLVNFVSFIWRAAMRAAFTAREYGFREGVRAVLRIPVTNIIAMMAARRAIGAYVATLRGRPLKWDKTFHHALPAALLRSRRAT
jgi:adsorption protein B